MKVAAYLRVSTMLQYKDGFSIEAQKHILKEYCLKNHLEVFHFYIDGGISGASIDERIALKTLLQDANKGCFQEVVTWKISRISRNVKDLLYILTELNNAGVTLRSISENLATDSLNGTFIIQMMGAVAEFEKNTIVENTKLGIHQRIRNGWYAGAPILGYDIVPKKFCEEQQLTTNLKINDKEADIVRLIFNLYEEGKGYKAIVTHLNKQEYRSKRDKMFSVNTIRCILKQRLFTGEIESKIDGKIEIIKGTHQPIISMEQWQNIHEKMQQQKIENGCKKRHIFSLSRLLRCPKCGSSMTGKIIIDKKKNGDKIKYYYYICQVYQNQGIKGCSAEGVPAVQIEEMVYHCLEQFIQNPVIINDVYKRLSTYDKTFKDKVKEINRIKQIEDKLEKRQKLLMIQFEADELSKEEFANQINTIKAEKLSVIKRKDEIQHYLNQHTKPLISLEAVEVALKQMKSILNEDKIDGIKSVLPYIIKSITVDKEKQLKNIEFKIKGQSILIENKRRTEYGEAAR